MEFRKRSREEAKAETIPSIEYKLPHDNRFSNILALLDSGTLHLYCEPDGIHLITPALHQAAVFWIHCPYECTSKSSSSHQIAVDQETLCKALNEISAVGVVYSQLSFFEEMMQLTSYNKQDRAIMHARISAVVAEDKKPLKIPPFVYGVSTKISARDILDVLPSGQDINLSLEENRLKMVVKTSVTLTTSGFLSLPIADIKEGCTYDDQYGELITKLIKKVLDSFKKATISLKFGQCLGEGDAPPLTIEGKYESSAKESILFLVEGQERDT